MNLRWMILAALLAPAMGGWAAGDAPPAAAGPAQPAVEEVVTVEQARNFVGKTVVVEGQVTGIRFLERSERQPVFLNFGEAFPNHAFTVVIFGKDRAKFGDTPPEKLFEGRRVRVRGKIEEYRGKPQIVVEDPAHIEVAPAPDASKN